MLAEVENNQVARFLGQLQIIELKRLVSIGCNTPHVLIKKKKKPHMYFLNFHFIFNSKQLRDRMYVLYCYLLS